MKKVIYTVLTGEYDQLIEPSVVNSEYDYVCLTDSPEKLKSETWEIVKFNSDGLSPVRLSRRPKIMPFEYFPNYDIVVYVDANLDLKEDIQYLIDKYPESEIIVAKHPYRSCIYDEERAVIRLRKDDEETTQAQMKRYKSLNFPKNYGLSHCNLIVWRNTENTKDFSLAWWNEVSQNSHRDQLSFDFTRWNLQAEVTRISQYEKAKYIRQSSHKTQKIYPSTMKSEGIDVVYPLGNSKTWGDNELRFSIRSVQKHFKDLRHIVIVGRKPRWLKNCIHIKALDNESYRDANLIKKMILAAQDKYVSDQFIWAADDKFLCEDVTFDELCGCHMGPISYLNPTEWEKWSINTREELKKRNLPYNDYNHAHAFQPVDSKEFLGVIAKWNWKKKNYTGSNIYNNSTEIFSGIDCSDIHTKIYQPLGHAEIIKLLHGKKSFNINSEGLNRAMKDTLAQLFPERTNYEVYGYDNDPYGEYLDWLEEKKFWEGVSLIERHTRNRQLIGFFRKKGETERTHKVLEKNLHIISRKWKHESKKTN